MPPWRAAVLAVTFLMVVGFGMATLRGVQEAEARKVGAPTWSLDLGMALAGVIRQRNGLSWRAGPLLLVKGNPALPIATTQPFKY